MQEEEEEELAEGTRHTAGCIRFARTVIRVGAELDTRMHPEDTRTAVRTDRDRHLAVAGHMG